MVQCFAKRNFSQSYFLEDTPQLAYVSRTDEENSRHPRVMHAHSDIVEIVLVTNGQGKYSIGGTPYPIRQGDLMIYNSGVVHDEPSGPDDLTRRYCCAIGNLKIKGLQPNQLIGPEEVPVFHMEQMQCQRVERLMELLFDTLTAGDEAACHYLMLALLHTCWMILHEKATPVEELSSNALGRRIKNYIDAHYAEEISLSMIAEQLKISPYYLAHVFKDMTQYSPMQYILRRRIGEAQTLLISTNLSVTHIAMQVGYDNASQFNQIFSKNVGMTPREYRKNYISKENEK